MNGDNAIEAATTLSRPNDTQNRSIGAVGILGITMLLGWLSGVEALLGIVPVGVLWYATSAPYTVAAAHIGLVALVPVVPWTALVVFELSSLAVLLGDSPEVNDATPVTGLLVVTVTTACLAAPTYGVLDASGDNWITAITLVVIFAVGAYGLHRYGVVRRRIREGTYE